jgi:hypothetical protein
VTGILSAIAVLAAVLEDRDAVVMSNEWSASVPTLEYDGRPVNHQFSKSAAFEVLPSATCWPIPPSPAGCPATAAGVLLLAERPDRALGRAGVRGP